MPAGSSSHPSKHRANLQRHGAGRETGTRVYIPPTHTHRAGGCLLTGVRGATG